MQQTELKKEQLLTAPMTFPLLLFPDTSCRIRYRRMSFFPGKNSSRLEWTAAGASQSCWPLAHCFILILIFMVTSTWAMSGHKCRRKMLYVSPSHWARKIQWSELTSHLKNSSAPPLHPPAPPIHLPNFTPPLPSPFLTTSGPQNIHTSVSLTRSQTEQTTSHTNVRICSLLKLGN